MIYNIYIIINYRKKRHKKRQKLYYIGLLCEETVDHVMDFLRHTPPKSL